MSVNAALDLKEETKINFILLPKQAVNIKKTFYGRLIAFWLVLISMVNTYLKLAIKTLAQRSLFLT